MPVFLCTYYHANCPWHEQFCLLPVFHMPPWLSVSHNKLSCVNTVILNLFAQPCFFPVLAFQVISVSFLPSSLLVLQAIMKQNYLVNFLYSLRHNVFLLWQTVIRVKHWMVKDTESNFRFLGMVPKHNV